MNKSIFSKYFWNSCIFMHFLKFSVSLIFVIQFPFVNFTFAQCEDEVPTDTFTFFGHIGDGAEAYHNIPTLASERLDITIDLQADDKDQGAAVEWEILSETGLRLNWDNYAVYDPVTRNMKDRGDNTSCANPSQLRIASEIYGFSYAITVKKFNRIGWNQVGTSWQTASLVQSGKTFCGSINVPLGDCATDHYFKIQLAPEDSLHVHGIFTASKGIGSAVSLIIYDQAQQYLDLLLNEAVYGTVENSGVYSNTGGTTETFYLILKSQAGDLWKYELQFFNAVYVNYTGDCAGKTPCYSTIQAAINTARTGQFILIAQGTYTGSVTLNQSKSLTLKGGWDPYFETQTGTTILRQEPKAQQGSLTLQEINLTP